MNNEKIAQAAIEKVKVDHILNLEGIHKLLKSLV